ncbi:MAG: recombination mediator RecR [Bacteroidales bacterium]
MQDTYFPSKVFEHAVHAIAKLPGIGNKTATRLVMHILKQNEAYAQTLGEAIINVRKNINYCSSCHTISDSEICEICSNPLRNKHIVCVVENLQDMLAIENTGQYKGVYHVLGGIISPMEGISAQNLTIDLLIKRVKEDAVSEIIFALPVTIEGDTTSYYIYKKLQDFPVTISMLSRGVSVGNDLEYADEATLARSIQDRITYSGIQTK